MFHYNSYSPLGYFSSAIMWIINKKKRVRLFESGSCSSFNYFPVWWINILPGAYGAWAAGDAFPDQKSSHCLGELGFRFFLQLLTFHFYKCCFKYATLFHRQDFESLWVTFQTKIKSISSFIFYYKNWGCSSFTVGFIVQMLLLLFGESFPA